MKLLFSPIRKYDFNPFHVPWWKQIIVAISYFLTSLISISFTTYPNTGSTPIWIPGGIAVGLVFLWGYSTWLGVFAGILMTQISIFQGWQNWSSFILVICITVVTSLGKILASLCSESENQNIFPQSDNRYFLHNVKNTAQFILFGCFISHLPVAIICACVVCGFGRATWDLFLEIALTWWLSDSFGILIFTPLIVAWQKQINVFIKSIKKQWLNTFIVSVLVFVIHHAIINTSYDIQFLYIPLVVWVVFKFQELGASLIVLVITINLMLATIAQTTSFAMESARDSLLILQSFIACIAMTTLLLGAVLRENGYHKQQLIKLNQDLSNKNKLLEELNRQKDLQSEAKEKILTEYNTLLKKQLTLAKAKEEAETLTKQNNQFFAKVSSDFIKPINDLMGMIDILANTKLNPLQEKCLKIIQKTSATLLKAINDVFNVSSIDLGNLSLQEEELQIDDVINSVNLLLGKQDKTLENKIYFSVPKDLPFFMGDGARIRQIFLNILSNGFCNESNSIFIDVQKANDLAENNLPKNKLYLLFKITNDVVKNNLNINSFSNNITQINKEIVKGDRTVPLRERTEEIFTNQSDNQELELFIAKKIIKTMGGKIWIENKGKIEGNPPSKWNPSSSRSIYSVYFTLELSPIIKLANEEKSGDIINKSSSLKILIAEDNPINQKIIIYSLKKLGYKAEIVTNGSQILEKVKNKKYDVIFLDIKMPILDGIETVKQLRKLYHNKHYIIALDPSREEEKDKYLSLGFNNFLSKPIDIEKLSEIITKCD
ncbi:MASE1 domain-containing protein [Cyanobacterium stanieri LEGE 03274]|uniref:histidine kinase n=1 Tax=Cyanobacterium stanieri LEGE 03274 TaxID=1828756 RepID=A0ABR9V1F4_9CHRO|nr:MASE1 domain-containing protein [Cyanobacterium stanieri]MBE9221729.1 MASE1 domain-containing protein [Cyanobacterium stanieri LEGE 03274]